MSYENIDDNGRIVVLRKRKQCEWCNVWIEVGEMATVRVYKFDGDFTSARMHTECFIAMKISGQKDTMGDYSFYPGEQGRGCYRDTQEKCST